MLSNYIDVGGGDNNDEYVDEDGVNNTDVNNEDVDDVKLDYIDDDVPIEETCVDYDHVDVDINVDIFDPRNWDSLNSDMIKRLLEKRCEIDSVALLQVAESENDSLIQSQAKSLATNELGDFEFLVAMVIWFEILYAVNLVSKKLQSNDMLIDIAIKEVKRLISFFEEFREMGPSKAINDGKEIVVEMDIHLVFVQKRMTVKFVVCTFEGRALTWWNRNVQTLGLANANQILWSNVKVMMTTEYCPATKIQKMEQELWTLTLKGGDIKAYSNRFHELVSMSPELVSTENKKIKKYIRGFPKRIKGNITSSKHATLHEAINMARELVEQSVQGRATRIGENNKRR
ncbi:putative reverse transcriptase domain-containing protein [Tanacetum coccineum]